MTSAINISNYETYVLDFLEGNLGEDLKLEFEAFLIANPSIAIEIEGLADDDLVVHETEPTIDKEHFMLKPSAVDGVNEDNYETVFAQALDEDLNPELKKAAVAFVDQNKFLATEFDLYQKTKIEADLAIVFGDKSNLTKPLPLWSNPGYGSLRIAASILILFGLFSVWNVLDSEIYTPRKGGQDFVSLPGPINDDVAEFTTDQKPQIAEAKTVVVPQVKWKHQEKRSDEAVPTLAALADLGPDWEPTLPEMREWPSLKFDLPEAIEDNTYASIPPQEALSIGQFLGQEFLGVEPEKASTTKALLKESAKKIIEQNDQIALNTTKDTNDKKTFSLMAGAIEFKRVTYKAN